MFYADYLTSDHWQSLRIHALARALNMCEACSQKEFLTVHHMRYRKLFDCTPEDLVVLCRNCHTLLHKVVHGKRASVEWFSREQTLNLIRYGRAGGPRKVSKAELKRRRKELRETKNRHNHRPMPHPYGKFYTTNRKIDAIKQQILART